MEIGPRTLQSRRGTGQFVSNDHLRLAPDLKEVNPLKGLGSAVPPMATWDAIEEPWASSRVFYHAYRMSLLDLTKATVICGGVAFLFYSYPILGQILAIAILSLLWLSYARKVIVTLLRRRRVA